MRERIFRGKRCDNGEWIKGGSIIKLVKKNEVVEYFIPIINKPASFTLDKDENIIAIEGCVLCKVIPETVGEYTGLKDKNGTKIFEGDIIKHYNNAIKPEQYDVYLIVFNERCCAFKGWLHKTFSAELRRDLGQYYEVIDNIHDNPELLEVTE